LYMGFGQSHRYPLINYAMQPLWLFTIIFFINHSLHRKKNPLKMRNILVPILLSGLVLFSCISGQNKTESTHPNFSGIYPHLAYYNDEAECGTGAVVPWADRLWVITYGPHLPFGSSDKLYEITGDLQQTIREESIG